MLKLFKKSIWIPYEDSTVYPTVAKAQQAIIKYCEDNGFLYEFTADDEVVQMELNMKYIVDMTLEVEETMALNVERSNSTNHNLLN